MSYNLANKKVNFSVAIRSDAYKNMINSTLGDKELAREFVANISAVVSNNYMLQNCDAGSIISAGLTASSLKLPLSQTLGFAYIIPYGNKAQFQIGWKGLVQLAIRSGQYKSIGCDLVREGEYLGRDELTGEPKFKFADDLSKATIGYYAYLQLVNGFTKVIYWSKEKCEQHAKTYSKSYGNGSKTDNWTNSFDTMALKTVVKQLISKWGIMSVDLESAIKNDQAVIKDTGEVEYVDNDNDTIPPSPTDNAKALLETKKSQAQEVDDIFDKIDSEK